MTNKKETTTYLDTNEFAQLKEISKALGLTMSKTIALCIVQGVELYKAELTGKEPVNFIEKHIQDKDKDKDKK